MERRHSRDLEFGVGCLNVGTQASPVTHGIVMAGASNAPIESPDEWIVVKKNKKSKTPSKEIETVSTKISSEKGMAGKPAWIKSLTKGFLPPTSRVKKMRSKECVDKVNGSSVKKT